MTELVVVSRYFNSFESIKLASDSTVKSDGNQIKAVYEKGSETTEYILNKYHVETSRETVDIPDESIVAGVHGNYLFCLIPRGKYGN